MSARTLRETAADADAARFVAREAELAIADDLLDPSTPSRILYLHGPGGIGKSTLARMIARKATDSGFTVETIDGRSGTRQVAERVSQLVRTHRERCFVVIDEADLIDTKVAAIRDRLLDGLAESSRIVFAGRRPPGVTWREAGLDAVFIDHALAPLSRDDAARLLRANGVADARVAALVDWSHGYPLALAVAALSPDASHSAEIVDTLEARLTSWLSGSKNLGVAPEILEAAALAPVVDARILAAALPSRSTRGAMSELRAMSVVEVLGDRAVLHPVLAAAIRSRLDAHAPERKRQLTRRIVTHLGSRARLGDIDALIELSQFIEDPELREAFSNRPSPSLFADIPTSNEFVAFGRAQGFDQGPDWDELVTFNEAAPYRLVVRRTDGAIALYGALARADDVPDLGPVTTSLIAANTASGPDPRRSFVGIVCLADLDDTELNDATRLGSGAMMYAHREPDMQAVFIHFPSPNRRREGPATSSSSRFDGDVPREVWINDLRPIGAAGFIEAIVLDGLGLPPRRVDHAPLLDDEDDPDRRKNLTERLDEVFDDTERDRRLRRVIELVHIEPPQPLETHLEELHVSRRTWFRLLRNARERVLDPDR